MKKQYTAPEVKVVDSNPSEIICTSASFGDGNTSIMHARGQGDFDFDADLWDE